MLQSKGKKYKYYFFGFLFILLSTVNNTELQNKLKTYRSDLHDLVSKKDQLIKDIGAKKYLEKM